ncbi:MAG: DNA polymerase I [Planctomycetia bacterium]|nr:DNA polymerase I [Planctomycetia bacterium]
MSKSNRQGSLFDAPDDAAPAERVTITTTVAAPVVIAEVPLTTPSVYVIDANSLIFQVFHAIPEMTSPAGEPVNAVYGFTRDLLFLLEKKQPTYLFCAFDMSGPTFRHLMYEQYKGQRSEMPDELVPQFPKIRRVVEALHIPILESPGFEADDILATLARLTDERGWEGYLVTGDKDCRQLITERVKVLNVRKDQVYGEAELQADWGVRPDQVVDFQAMVGDSVDNVPGVPQIGPKAACELLNKYNTLEGVYEHLEEITAAKRKQTLADHRDQAFLSQQLARLDQHMPLDIDWDAGRAGGFMPANLLKLFGEFGFHRFGEQVKALATKLGQEVPLDVADAPAVPQSSDWNTQYQVVDTLPALQELVAAMSQQTLLSFDTETTHVNPAHADLVGFSFAWEPGKAFYVPVRGPAGDRVIEPSVALETLRPVLENDAIKKLGQNLKYDIVALRTAGAELRGVAADTMVASYLLDAGERIHNLDELAERYLHHTNIKITELIGSGKNQKRMDEAPVAAVGQYAAEDADVPLRLWPILEQQLLDANLMELFDTLEVPLIEVLAELESNGIKVDVAHLQGLSEKYGVRIVELEREVYELAGHEFNIASPKQLQQVLFVEQGLPVLKKTKTGPSTDAEVLEELAAQHPLPAKILEYRQFAKLKGTYVDALPALVNPRTGRVHAGFHQAVAATGRLSSSDPNLQNIPIRTETGREIRAAFLPGEPGWKLLAADYSQIELRVLAHFSRDETLCAAFAQDEDIHTLVASQVYGVSLGEVTKEMRRAAKAVNFGIVYGQSPFGLAKQLGIDQVAAAKFIDEYFARYPGVESFMAQTLAECRATGYVKTILGRRRAIQGVRSDAGRQRNLPERTAINTVIQGSAADLIKRAMVAIYRRMKSERLAARMLLQIHDELVFEAPEAELGVLAKLVSEEMASGIALSVPVKIDVKIGANWAAVEAAI